MSIAAAYTGVVFIWASTPLAIQWSLVGDEFLFGVGSRIVLGAMVCLALMGLLGMRLPVHGRALRAYLAGAVAIYGAMMCVYWGARYVPSGLVSVLFGLTPVFTGVMAMLWLGERGFGPARALGLGLGLGGLVLVFGGSSMPGLDARIGNDGEAQWRVMAGMGAVLLSALLHALSTVWVKRIDAGLSAMAMTGGSLAVSAPLYVLTWWLVDGHWPAEVPPRAGLAIVYLGLFGSVLGFVLFYYVLHRVEAGRVALITLISPVLALIAGQQLNGENLTWQVWGGSGLILSGLLAYQRGEAWYTTVVRAIARSDPRPPG